MDDNVQLFMEFNLRLFHFTALMSAVQNGHTDIVRELLKQKDIDVNIRSI